MAETRICQKAAVTTLVSEMSQRLLAPTQKMQICSIYLGIRRGLLTLEFTKIPKHSSCYSKPERTLNSELEPSIDTSSSRDTDHDQNKKPTSRICQDHELPTQLG
jgi:hypothetical protein